MDSQMKRVQAVWEHPLYQQNLKLQRAKELLSTTDESIKEIAYRLNFESPDYFSAKFKIQTGMKPSDFRNMTR